MSDLSYSCSFCVRLKDRCPRPHGLLNLLITKACLLALLFGVVWAITGSECLPGGNLFGIVTLFICSVLGGNLAGLMQLPSLPPLPPLLGMLLAGLLLRNVPYVNDAVKISAKMSAATRSLGLGVILARAGLGLDPSGIPTLLMAAGSFDDVLAITGFSTCLGISFSKGSTWMNVLKGLLEVGGGVVAGLILGLFLCCFPSRDQEDLALRRTLLLLGLSIFAVFFTHVIGAAGAGGLCTLVLAFIAALGWNAEKAPVAAMVGRSWDVFQPLLFGLIGAEIVVANLNPVTVGLGVACVAIGLVIRLLVTFLLVHFGGFNWKEKLFIAVAWTPKATVQAAIGSKALDMAREEEDQNFVKFGSDVLTLAVLAILITAPIGALGIGLAGPRLLDRQVKGDEPEGGASTSSSDGIGQERAVTLESKL
ncbi:sodium/hydrogen exchanger 9B2-like isoform X3 [Takifugu rubripes]|uniref:sodium/hydrogen exchanger 9B2-like isoform X3 n=1 Tax=Takifugu rubripes TaxID=31033 RepID=UPI0011460B3B|nr:sodium/hydrogen exchanger 9B2-like isoform X3 [Takifugu rubripes]